MSRVPKRQRAILGVSISFYYEVQLAAMAMMWNFIFVRRGYYLSFNFNALDVVIANFSLGVMNQKELTWPDKYKLVSSASDVQTFDMWRNVSSVSAPLLLIKDTKAACLLWFPAGSFAEIETE
jgi:hypothetical protein